MYVLQEPERRRWPTIVAEREAKHRTITPYNIAPFIDRRRFLSVSMNPPEDIGLSIIRHIILSGDRRYWSWSARKASSKGNVRKSLAYELCVDKDNLNTSIRKLQTDGIIEFARHANGQETIRLNEKCLTALAEVKWRWLMRECAPDFLSPMAENYGWQEISIQVDRYINVEQLDPARRSDVARAAKEQLKDGVEAGGSAFMIGFIR